MRVTEVTFSRLKKREESYENERVGVTAKVEKGEDPRRVLAALRVLVDRAGAEP